MKNFAESDEMSKVRFSVCIPAFNRSCVLSELLMSIIKQRYKNYEIVIVEDCSPEREEIRKVVEKYAELNPGFIKYVENETNIGYDANIRKLIEVSSGEYVVLFGNDDVMAESCLDVLNEIINRYGDVGLIVRSYASFDGNQDNIVQVYRYFKDEVYLPSGIDAIACAYRRSVVVSGLTINRKQALRYATKRYDGTLLYQVYLVMMILKEVGVVFTPAIIALYRNGGVPDFGNSVSEKNYFEPKKQTSKSSVYFVESLIRISFENSNSERLHKKILKDMANYSFPFFLIQSKLGFKDFVRYGYELALLGLGSYPLFWGYFVVVMLFGAERVEFIIKRIKERLGYTPKF